MDKNKIIVLLVAALAVLSIALVALLLKDASKANSKPEYDSKTSVATNCRAYVQSAVDEWHYDIKNTEETLSELERNCGVTGILWEHKYEPEN